MLIEGTGFSAAISSAAAGATASAATASTPVDLDALAPIRTETQTTADGKTVQVEYLHEDGDVTVTRETTFNDFGGITSQQIAFDTSAGNDIITIDGRANSGATVSVNGQEFTTSVPTQGTGEFDAYGGITVRSGAGNDVIEVAAGSNINLTAEGGFGNDRIVGGSGQDRLNGGFGSDTLIGNGGRDDLFGAAGDDVLEGGSGDDVLYGGYGADRLSGQAGDDYLEGGTGADTISGGAGQDILSGGRNDDRLYGGTGDDTYYTGHGADFVSNLGGNDTVYGQVDSDRITTASLFDDPRAEASSNTVINVELNSELGKSSITVEGSYDFVQRTEADLELMRSSPVGQQALASFDQAFSDNGHTVTIRELASEKNGFAAPDDFALGELDASGTPGAGTSVEVFYNPSFGGDFVQAPIFVLAHELAHANNFVTGTLQTGTYTSGGAGHVDNGVRNLERQAVGLENDGVPYDGDNDPATPLSTVSPEALTENGLRAEAGVPLAPSYNPPPPPAPPTTGPGGPR